MPDLITTTKIIVLGLIGGIIRHMLSPEVYDDHSFGAGVKQALTGVFSGYIGYHFIIGIGGNESLAIVLAGLGGFWGIRFLEVLINYFKNKYNK